MTTFRENDAVISITRVLSRRDVTVVDVILESDGGVFDQPVEGTGIAVRSKSDDPDSSLGFDIALARALEHLAIRANRQVHGRIKHMDDIADMKLNRAVDEVVVKIKTGEVELVPVKKYKKKKKVAKEA